MSDLPEIRSIEDLRFDPKNPNLGTDRGREVIAGSLEEIGFGRSVFRLMVGDSFSSEDRGRLLEGVGRVDAAVTDPPYAIYGSASGISSEIADDKMVRPFFERLGHLLAETLREFGHAYVHCDWRSYATLWVGLRSAGLSPKNCIVWDKGSAGLGSSYANTHEFVAFFARRRRPRLGP